MENKEQIRLDALKFLQENSTAVIATSFKDDPRASTVYYSIDNDFNFYFITKRKTNKYFNAELNPKVALVVGFGPEHISVQAHGTVELIVDEEDRDRIANLIVGRQNLKGVTVWPIDEMENLKNGEKVIFKIIPDELVYMNIDGFSHSDTISNEYMKII